MKSGSRVALACALALLLLAAQAQAQSGSRRDARENKELIAVLDFESSGASKQQAAALTERLREELLGSGEFRIVDRSQTDKIMGEQALQQTGCTSSECAVQVGKILGVRKMVNGRIIRVENNLWLASCVLLDVESAETLRSVSVQIDGSFSNMLVRGAQELAYKVAGRAPPAPVQPAKAEPKQKAAPSAASTAAPAAAAAAPPAAPAEFGPSVRDSDYSAWMSFDEFDVMVQGLHAKRRYPVRIQGRLAGGVEQFRAALAPYPEGAFRWKVGYRQTRGFFESQNQANSAAEFKLISYQDYKDAESETQVQSVWRFPK